MYRAFFCKALAYKNISKTDKTKDTFYKSRLRKVKTQVKDQLNNVYCSYSSDIILYLQYNTFLPHFVSRCTSIT